MPTLRCLAVLLLTASCVQADEKAVREAVTRALPLVQKAAANYPKHRECFSCHHQTLPMLAMVTARDRGILVDEKLLQAQAEFSHKSFNGRIDGMKEGKGIGGRALTVGYGLWTLDLVDWKPDETTDAMAAFLVKAQHADGHWAPQTSRPPLEDSSVTCTVLAAYGLQRYARGRLDDTIATAKLWLLKAEAKSQEDRVARLWGIHLLGGDAAQIKAIRASVLAAQKQDGGWAQLDDMKSDAYATGLTLFVLQESGLPTTDAAYQRGVQFLLKTQHADGSWLVETRSKPIQVYFDNGDPHGKHQFISTPATSWAVAALTATLAVRATGVTPVPPKTLPPELDIIPRDMPAFLSVRVADLWQSDATKELRQLLAAAKPDFAKSVEKTLGGIALADVERFTIVGGGPKIGGMMILTSRKPFDRAKVREAFNLGSAEEKQLQSKTYYDDGSGGALHFLNDRTLMVGPVAVEKAPSKDAGRQFLERAFRKQAEGPLSPAVQLAASPHHVVVGLNPSFIKEMAGELPPPFAKFEPLLRARSAAVTVDFREDGLLLDAHLSFANGDQAQDGEKALKAGIAQMQEIVTATVKRLTDNPSPNAEERKAQELQVQMLRLFEPALKAVAVGRQGDKVQASLRLKGKDSANVITIVAKFLLNRSSP